MRHALIHLFIDQQLDTANLSGYSIDQLAAGERIILRSLLNLNLYQCIISTDADSTVTSVSYH